MLMYDAAMFGIDLKTKLGKSDVTNITAFCDLVMKRVMHEPSVTNKPTGAAVQAQLVALGGVNRTVMEGAISLGAGAMVNNGAGGPIIIALIGETHSTGVTVPLNALRDAARANDVAKKLAGTSMGDRTLVIEERGLNYSIGKEANYVRVSESDLTGTMFSIAQRSVAVAAYGLQVIAGGDQSKKTKLVVFIGDEHVPQVHEACEYIIANSTSVPWLKYRSRAYYILNTQVA